ncbi:nucleolar and spindle-associated protein 1-like isoform X2 [Clavelina lepadiformis]|uniref:nucleolar and spindle-associated protein 1-like isoform X2 n=1 Tax=Clavelina lepadiformis TaxID=159417 RepID=UPI00404206ED
MENLHSLKRSELQKLAKEYGIKANLKNSKIIEALQQKLESVSAKEQTKKDQDKIVSPITNKNISTSSDDSIDGIVTVFLNDEKPLWGDSSCNISSDGSSPQEISKSRSRSQHREDNEEIVRTRSSSRNKKEKSADETSDGQSKVSAVTPHKSIPDISSKTFSLPKKGRAQARIPLKDKTPKAATKRRTRSSDKATVTAAKRARKCGSGWKSEMKKAAKAIPVLETTVKHTTKETETPKTMNKSIPVFTAAGVTITKSTPIANKFAKAHEKNFNKMESIDDYQRRKEERAAKLFGSNQKRQMISRLAQPKTKTPVIAKPVTRPKPNFMSPLNKKENSQPRRKSAKPQSIFKPTVFSTSKIDTNFSKPSRLVTPKKVSVTFAKSPNKQKKRQVTPKTPAATSTPSGSTTRKSSQRTSLTPFRTANTPQSKKNAFNLEESLKKPLTWVPHKGPIKSYKETASNPTQPFKERIKNIKNPKVTTRDKRRVDKKKTRDTKKSSAMMRRRGIV